MARVLEMDIDDLARELAALASAVRAVIDPVPLGGFIERLDKVAAAAKAISEAFDEELEDVRRGANDEIAEAKREQYEAEEQLDAAAARADEAEAGLEDILEAAVAAREGRPGAAAATVRLLADRTADLAGAIDRLTGLARIRPADYWNH